MNDALAPACMPCPEPGGTCFPGPCKLYAASRAAAEAMTHAEKALAFAKKLDIIATGIVTDVAIAVRLRCDNRPEFMAIMLGAVHAKIGRLLVETEQKVRADD